MSLNELPMIMVRCLILTIVIEVIVGLIIGIRNKKDIINVILVNIVTNPVVVSIPILIYLCFGYNYERLSLYILEVITLFVEGVIYLKVLNYKKINPFLISLFLNLSSYLIGELINYFL